MPNLPQTYTRDELLEVVPELFSLLKAHKFLSTATSGTQSPEENVIRQRKHDRMAHLLEHTIEHLAEWVDDRDRLDYLEGEEWEFSILQPTSTTILHPLYQHLLHMSNVEHRVRKACDAARKIKEEIYQQL